MQDRIRMDRWMAGGLVCLFCVCRSVIPSLNSRPIGSWTTVQPTELPTNSTHSSRALYLSLVEAAKSLQEVAEVRADAVEVLK